MAAEPKYHELYYSSLWKFFSVKKDTLISFLILTTAIFIHYILNSLFPDNSYAWVISILIWGCGLYWVRRSIPVVILFLFFISYLWIPYYHFFDSKQISIYHHFQSSSMINRVSFLNSIFVGFFSLVLKNISDKKLLEPMRWVKSNEIIFYLTLIPCFISLYFGLRGESLIVSGYGQSEVQKSALHEYFIVFYLFTLLFMSKDSKIQKVIVILLLIFYSFKTLIYGGRIEVIQIGLLFFYVYYNYLKNISRFLIYGFMCAGWIFMSMMGSIRSDPVLFLESLNSSTSFISFFISSGNSPYLMTTSSDVYYSSMRMLGLVDIGVLDFSNSFHSFLSYIFNIFLSFSEYKVLSNLAILKVSEYPVGGGGLIHTYFFVWLGYIGVILIAFFLGGIIQLMHSNCSFVIRVYGLLLLVTFPRWFAYTPINLVKICIVGVIMYFLFLVVKGSLKNSTRIKRFL